MWGRSGVGRRVHINQQISSFSFPRHFAHQNPAPSPFLFRRTEVAKHDNIQDCWIIIRGKVYNVSKWFLDHPGSEGIAKRAGRDATTLFEEGELSNLAKEDIKNYYIGDIAPDETKPRRVDLSALETD